MRILLAVVLPACALLILTGTSQPQDKTPDKPSEKVKKAADLGKPQQFKFGEADFLLVPAQLSRKELHGLTTQSDKIVLTNKDGKKFNLEGIGASALKDEGIDTGDGRRTWAKAFMKTKDGEMLPVLGIAEAKNAAVLIFITKPGTQMERFMDAKKVYWGGVLVACADSKDVPPPEPPPVLLLFRYKGPQEDLTITVPGGRKIKL